MNSPEVQGIVRLLFSEGRAEEGPLSNTYRESPVSAIERYAAQNVVRLKKGSHPVDGSVTLADQLGAD